MNYYERHLGDYAKDTMRLSMLEHGAYNLLIDFYYGKEKGIPAKDAYKVAQARSKAEKEATDYVLAEFFLLIDGIWIKGRIEEEITKYQAGEPEREAKKANEDNRIKRHREERASLFQALTAAGLHAEWNIKIGALRELVKNIPATPPVTETVTETVTAHATLATATQAPSTIHQTPVVNQEPHSIEPTSTTEPPVPGEPAESSPLVNLDRCKTIASRIMKFEAARGKGAKVFGSDGRVQGWVKAGISDPQLREAYEMAVTEREDRKDQTPVNAGFLDVFVAKLLNPPDAGSAVLGVAKAWHETALGIESKGEELGIGRYHPDAFPGGFPEFKARVLLAAGIGVRHD